MPSLKAYTPYETLAFCQSVAHHGADSAAFEDIAQSLNANQLIRDNQTYDESRLTASALQALYQELLVQEKTEKGPVVNGDGGATVNPRKRKASLSPPPVKDNDLSGQQWLQSLVDRLYERFREQTIKEIRLEEEAYHKVQAEIVVLEKQPEDEQLTTEELKSRDLPQKGAENVAPKAQEPQSSPDAAAAQLQASLDASRAEQAAAKGAAPVLEPRTSPSTARAGHPQALSVHSPAPTTPGAQPRPPTETPQARASKTPKLPQQPSPGAYQRPLPGPGPSPQRPDYVQQHFQPSPQGHPMPILPHAQGMPPMPPPMEYPGPKRGTSASRQGKGSPVPMQPQQPFPGYQGYPQPHWPPPVAPQYGHSQPYPPNGQFYPYHTPQHPPYQQYPQSAPIHYASQPSPAHGWHPQYGQPYYGPHGSANVTPVPRNTSKQPVPRARSSTPWKRRAEPPNIVRQPSPGRPERDVSPLTDSESPSRSKKVRKSPGKRGQKAEGSFLSTQEAVRGRQGASTTPGVADSRSQSIASYASDTPTDKRRRGRPPSKIKAEPPSTPAPLLSDTEQPQQSRGRPGRPRKDAAPPSTTEQVQNTATKRKRSHGRDTASPPLPSAEPVGTLRRQVVHDPSLVSVTKNFAKTAQLLLNEITSHKVASIFAKPLSERDAPGYKKLVFRSQDLKSIKAAVSKGGRAALAAIESLETDDRDGEETPTKNVAATATESGERSLGNGVYLVNQTEDLVPPKGIVNSAQLEMELVRMFANAVMFNPLPTSERGFGRSLRLRKRGGDVDSNADADDASSSEEGSPVDEGGIISDAREMFDDVMAAVRKWREVEIERLGGDDAAAAPGTTSKATHPSTAQGSASASVRHSSVSSAVNEDDAAGETPAASVSTPVPASGTARKRRRIAE
ncbi:hypothetical protein EDD37DRAFT_347855 [Exophiala viscosa]|uniref:Bromo domain-containing protein n=1 Tax=Exophiala viscosa TaxID=2486360 RepID=A0AAN6DV75_9EURO|nr:hypothetical protein EDD36DRAFT_263682 [Exophiala viscosa]KAI1626453.1 hypothetical protein EDD37DRAFT_347855 [Exophiala viscosa]